MAPHPQPTAVEQVPAGEPRAIVSMIETLKKQLEKRYVEHQVPVLRDAHPKNHGLVIATFEIDPKCPGELRHGVFKTPRERFKAEIRFSNGHPHAGHDLKADVRGMAIKLLDVPGGTLLDPAAAVSDRDFLITTGEAFFGKDAIDFVEFPEASERAITVIWWLIRGLRVRGAWQLWRGNKTPGSLLRLQYFSQVPYRLGPHCVKYSALPSEWTWPRLSPWYLLFGIRHALGLLARLKFVARVIPGANSYREALARELASRPYTFDFLIQRWPDLSELPVWAIEDATKRWTAPWVRAATITIHQQDDIASRDKRAERLSFTPWRVAAEHQPLGSISRARLAIYREMSVFRNKLNEPVPVEVARS